MTDNLAFEFTFISGRVVKVRPHVWALITLAWAAAAVIFLHWSAWALLAGPAVYLAGAAVILILLSAAFAAAVRDGTEAVFETSKCTVTITPKGNR